MQKCIDYWENNDFDNSKVVLLLWIIYAISVLFLLCFRVRLLIYALWADILALVCDV